MTRELSREEMKSWTIGAMALATGGGGVRPLAERAERMVDEAFDQGKKYELVDVIRVLRFTQKIYAFIPRLLYPYELALYL